MAGSQIKIDNLPVPIKMAPSVSNGAIIQKDSASLPYQTSQWNSSKAVASCQCFSDKKTGHLLTQYQIKRRWIKQLVLTGNEPREQMLTQEKLNLGDGSLVDVIQAHTSESHGYRVTLVKK